MGDPTPNALGWRQRRWVLPAVVIAGLAIRMLLSPAFGWVGDIDQFVDWVRSIAKDGLGHAYDTPISFGPVMVFVWWVLGLVDPAIVAAASSADVGVRIAMKLPAIAADVAIAGVAWWGLRTRPGWATVAVAVVLLHPAIWFVSAWWGQYDSVYVAFGVAAFVLTVRGHDRLAVVALVLAVMTKPQAAPLAIPFAAWFLARAGWRGANGSALVAPVRRLAVLGAVGISTLVILWLPFLAANGPQNYLAGVAHYQGEQFGMLSLQAWNPWWMVQELLAGGNFVFDSGSLAGPLSYRLVGFLMTGLLFAVVAICVARRPTPRMLAVGLGTAALVAFEFLTAMHERYAFAVLPLLVFVLDSRRTRVVASVFGVTFFMDLLSAATGAGYIEAMVPAGGPVSVAGSAVNVACVLVLVVDLVRSSRRPEPASAINDAAWGAVWSAPPSTSAGSGGATSGA